MNAEHDYEKRKRIVVKPIGISHDPENLPLRFAQLQKEMVEPAVFEPWYIVYDDYKIPITIKSITSGVSRKGGGFGTRYCIEIRKREFDLYHVHDVWFIEGELKIG